jgi:ATP adenylyltransferase
MTIHEECCLCGQIRGEEAHDLIARLLPAHPYVRRVPFESPSFAVIPSLGPLCAGHSLLCPKAHLISFAQLDSGQDAEFVAMKTRLRAVLAAAYGPDVALFEHGMAASGGRVPCTVAHAHLHFVPVPRGFDLGDQEGAPWQPFDGSLAALRTLAGRSEYVLYESYQGDCRLLLADERGHESQYMRRIFAGRLGDTMPWDWRESPAPLATHETWRRVADAQGGEA